MTRKTKNESVIPFKKEILGRLGPCAHGALSGVQKTGRTSRRIRDAAHRMRNGWPTPSLPTSEVLVFLPRSGGPAAAVGSG